MLKNQLKFLERQCTKIPKKVIAATILFEIYFAVIGAASLISSCNGEKKPDQQNVAKTTKDIAIAPKEVWQAPDENTIPKGERVK